MYSIYINKETRSKERNERFVQIKSISLFFLLFLTAFESIKPWLDYFCFWYICLIFYTINVISCANPTENCLHIYHTLNHIFDIFSMQESPHLLLHEAYTNYCKWSECLWHNVTWVNPNSVLFSKAFQSSNLLVTCKFTTNQISTIFFKPFMFKVTLETYCSSDFLLIPNFIQLLSETIL